MYLNHFQCIGRMVADPTLTPGSRPDGSDRRAWFRLAINRPVGEASSVDFMNVVCWGDLAQMIGNYGRKGKELLVTGEIRTQSKKRSDGTYDNYAEIRASQISLGADPKPQQAPTPEEAPPLPQEPQTPSNDLSSFLANAGPEVIALLAKAAASQVVGSQSGSGSQGGLPGCGF